MKLECAHVETCLPDYWSGHQLPHVQIPVWKGMHLKQVRDSIKDELRQGAVMGNSEQARLLSADYVNTGEEKEADRLTRAAYAAVNRIRPAVKGKRRLFEDLEEQVEGDDTVYAYFVFVTE